MNTQPARLAIVERSAVLPPREIHFTSSLSDASDNAAYRRLAAVILSLDVATLAAELSAKRLEGARMSRHAA